MTALSAPDLPRRMTPPLLQAAAVIGLLGILTLPLIVLDTRPLDGEALWIKPLKFAASIALFLATLDWAIRRLPGTVRDSRWIRGWSWAAIATMAIEFTWIAAAAALGTRSHYNETEPFFVALYPVMGLAAVTGVLAAGMIGASLLRHGWGEVERAAGWGFVTTAALGIPFGMALSGMPNLDAGLPMLGWTFAPGDMRPAHFLSIHAMQAVPLAALALARLRPLPFGTGRVLAMLWAIPTVAAGAYGFDLI